SSPRSFHQASFGSHKNTLKAWMPLVPLRLLPLSALGRRPLNSEEFEQPWLTTPSILLRHIQFDYAKLHAHES
ncbi:hypothetical protein ACSTK1_23615, partial [Vibrio parahaemolyticus]